MEVNGPAVNASGNGQSKADQLCSVLDALVAMRWDLSQHLRDSPDLPETVTFHLLRVSSELDGTISALKIFIGEGGLLRQSQAPSVAEK
jgi:hypothetical protein